ncbi:MAG: immunoglobulin domain-containing protein [Verrucomicrobiota bacterium]
MKRFIPPRRVLLPLATLLPFLGWIACGQAIVVSNYTSLNAAIQSSSSPVITNFAGTAVINLTPNYPTLQITNDVMIDGTTNTVVIDGNNLFRLFHVNPNARLVLNNVQLLRGLSTNGGGGAIFNEGTLIISNAIIAGNSATNFNGTNGINAATNSGLAGTDAAGGGGALGGAIYSHGPVSVYFSVFLTNQALAGSGGIGGNGANSSFAGNGGNGGAGGGAFGGAVMSTGNSNVFFATEFISNNCVAGSGGSGGSGGVGALSTGNGASGQGAGGGAAAGGGLYATGSLFVADCLFFNNVAVGGGSGAAQLLADGTGANGIAGAPAGGGGIYLSNSAPTADIENTIFFGNLCVGGPGGPAAGASTIAGNGGAVYGGGIFSGAAAAMIRNCTLATNTLDPGTFGSDSGTNGVNGLEGSTNGWQIYCSAGVVRLANSILSGGASSNAVGVTDAGYNISSDASPTKSTSTTRNSANPGLDAGLTADGGFALGPANGAGPPMLTLQVIAGSPATNAIPGVPGLTFPATDERGAPRGTPGSVGAFEVNGITVYETAPATISEPTNQTARVGAAAHFSVTAVANSGDPNPLGYQWQLNGANLIDNASFAGATSNTLTVKDISAADLGAYRVVVSPSLLDSEAVSSNAYLLVKIPPSIRTQPSSKLNEPYGAVVTFKVKVGGAPPFSFQWRSNEVALTDGNEFSGSATSNLTINPVTFQDAASYTVVVGNYYRSVTSVVARLTVKADTTPPTVTITSPAPGARSTNAVISGTASDNAQVTNVSVSATNFFLGTNLVTSAVLSTNGTTKKTWTSLTNAFFPGTNMVAVQSVDYSSNVSPIVVRKFFYAVPSPFAFSITGKGSVAGSASAPGGARPTNGAQLNLTEGYTLSATPGQGYLLTNWTSPGFTSNGNILHFVMTPNLSIQANFVPSPFMAVAGVYNGLFFPTNKALTEHTAGLISHLTLGSLGRFSGKLLLDGATYSLGGVFDIFGHASNHIARAAARGGPVSVVMAVGWTNHQILGSVSGTNEGGWESALCAEEGAAPLAVSGQYTVLLPPSTNVVGEVPPGYGYVLLTNHLGYLTLAGALPDGAAFSQSVPIGKLGNVPVFASLYHNAGLLLGWISLTNGTPQGETNFTWIKPAAAAGIYTNGFTNSLSVQGSAWLADAALPLTAGTLTISNASLYLTNRVSFDNNLVVAESGPANSLRGTINLKTGAIKLIFGNGEGKATTTGYAALLQDATNAGGYFVTKTNAGFISLKP